MYKNYSKIDKVISEAAKHHKLEAALHKYQVIKHWEKVVTAFIDEAKDATKAIDLQKGVLLVACLSKEVAYQIRLLAHRIMEEINKLVGKSLVFAIQVEC